MGKICDVRAPQSVKVILVEQCANQNLFSTKKSCLGERSTFWLQWNATSIVQVNVDGMISVPPCSKRRLLAETSKFRTQADPASDVTVITVESCV